MTKSLLFILTALGLSLGNAPAQDTTTKTAKKTGAAVAETTKPAADTTKKTASAATDATKKTAATTTETTKKAAGTAADTTKKAANTAADTTKKATETAKTKTSETTKAPDKKAGELSEADKALRAHAEKEAAKLNAAQKRSLLDLVNHGDAKALIAMPGVGEVKADSIKKARPFKAVDDLIMVDGIGEVTFDGIVKWTAGGMATAEPAETKAPVPPPAAKKKP